MFRKENGVTLVALVVTIIVLLILAGVTIAMVVGDEGIISQASGANTAQNKAMVTDQATMAYATVRAEDIARLAGVQKGAADADGIAGSEYANAIGYEMVHSGAFASEDVKIGTNVIYVKTKGTKETEYFKITINATDKKITDPIETSNVTEFSNNANTAATAY